MGLAFLLSWLCGGVPWLGGCAHTRNISREMRWADDSELMAHVPHATTSDAVCLRFIQAPHFVECLYAPEISGRLQAFQKKEVPVVFEVTCKSSDVAWYRPVTVDGRPVGVLENAIGGDIGTPARRSEYPFAGACH